MYTLLIYYKDERFREEKGFETFHKARAAFVYKTDDEHVGWMTVKKDDNKMTVLIYNPWPVYDKAIKEATSGNA